MAGWDGDDLAGSMEEALERQQERAEARLAQKTNMLSTEERERKARFESVKLSRARIEEQLARAVYPAHRTMLERALASLDAEIEASGVAVNKQNL